MSDRPDFLNHDLLWLTEEHVRALVSLNDVIDALAEGLALEAAGAAANVDKALGTWTGGTMHALGSMMPDRGYVAFKTWANTPAGASAVLSLFSSTNGRMLALMEAAALGSMRTSAISGLATRQLADPAADEMAIIGTGSQAIMQVAAIAATRKLARLHVFSPTPEKRAAFVANAQRMFDFPVVEHTSVEDAVKDVPIITLITRAKAPFLSAGMVAKGTHINAPGAIMPAFAEFEQDIFDRADVVAVDSLSGARKNSSEFIARYGSDEAGWGGVTTIGALLADGIRRPAGADITLFKSMGMGLSDLSVAVPAFERAVSAGVGFVLPRGARAPANWSPASAPVTV